MGKRNIASGRKKEQFSRNSALSNQTTSHQLVYSPVPYPIYTQRIL
jgi:hypothetical protein